MVWQSCTQEFKSYTHSCSWVAWLDFWDTNLEADIVKCSSASVAEIAWLARLQCSNVSQQVSVHSSRAELHDSVGEAQRPLCNF